MKCFHDPTQDAVGICKSCGKGLSSGHAVDLGKGLACKGSCEDEVRELIALIDNNIATQEAGRNYFKGAASEGYGSALFFVAMGSVFGGIGFLRGEAVSFPTIMGAVIIVYGLWQVVRVQRRATLAKKFYTGE